MPAAGGAPLSALGGCPDERSVIDELPPALVVAEAEIELVSQHMHAIVAAMFGDAMEDEE